MKRIFPILLCGSILAICAPAQAASTGGTPAPAGLPHAVKSALRAGLPHAVKSALTDDVKAGKSLSTRARARLAAKGRVVLKRHDATSSTAFSQPFKRSTPSNIFKSSTGKSPTASTSASCFFYGDYCGYEYYGNGYYGIFYLGGYDSYGNQWYYDVMWHSTYGYYGVYYIYYFGYYGPYYY